VNKRQAGRPAAPKGRFIRGNPFYRELGCREDSGIPFREQIRSHAGFLRSVIVADALNDEQRPGSIRSCPVIDGTAAPGGQAQPRLFERIGLPRSKFPTAAFHGANKLYLKKRAAIFRIRVTRFSFPILRVSPEAVAPLPTFGRHAPACRCADADIPRLKGC